MSRRTPRRKLVITICPRERGTVTLAAGRGLRRRRMNASTLARELRALVSARDLGRWVDIREGCAGGCWSSGPNVTVTLYPPARDSERADQVAIGWKTYVYSLAGLDRVSRIVDDNLY
jgi:hypothetical protein